MDETLQQATGPVDPDGGLLHFLRTASAMCERLHALAMQAVVSARADATLTPDDGVVEGLSEQVDVLADLHDAIEAVRERVELLDAQHSARGDAVYRDPYELIDSIRARA